VNDDELLGALRRDIDASTGKTYDQLNHDRAKALKYYLGEPYGNEIDGRSKIVTTEVADTIESMLPQILKVFVASERAVYFDPVGPEDEQASKQETDYVNHVFYKENDGFGTLYAWFKDALLSKNGIVKYYWEEKDEVVTESYTNLTEDELMALLGEDGVEVVEQTSTSEQQEQMVQTPMGPQPMVNVVTSFDVKIKRSQTTGQCRVDNVPPEEFLIDADYNSMSLKQVPFCAHEREMTVSDLAALGYDTDEIMAYAGKGDGDYDTVEKDQRFADISDSTEFEDEGRSDPSMRLVKVTECYKRVDYDGDGYAELRRIMLVNDTHILDNEEFDYVPFEVISPVPMTHRFFGRSAADQTMDLQLQKSMLMRNILDNLYLTNNVRHGAVEGEVNLGDLLDNTPGGVVRMTAPGMVQPLPVQPFTGHAFGMLEYIDSVKENRTGVTRYNQGIDADSLNKTASGINRIMDASAQRLELIARLFGEGVKRLMLGIHRLLLQNQDKEKIVQLRGQWVPVNPSEWKDRTNMTVVVGLGTENKDKLLSHLMMILETQKEAMMAGVPVANVGNLYNTLVKMVENSGLKEPSLFYTDPSTVPPTPPEPSAEEKMVMAQTQAAQQEAQLKAQKQAQDYELGKQKLNQDYEIRMAELQLKYATEGQKAVDNALDRAVDAARSETETMGSMNA